MTRIVVYIIPYIYTYSQSLQANPRMSVFLQTLSTASGVSRPQAVSQTLPLIARLQTRTDLLIKSIELFSYHLHLFPHGVPTKCVTSWGERRHWALSTRQASSVRLNCRTRGQRSTLPQQSSIENAFSSCLTSNSEQSERSNF